MAPRRIEEVKAMKRFVNILCVLETGKTGGAALERVAPLAESNQASLTVVTVIERVAAGMTDSEPILAGLHLQVESRQAEDLETLVDPYRKGLEVEAKVLIGTPFLEIIREVLRGGYDLLIKSPETLDWLDRLFSSDDMGNTAERILGDIQSAVVAVKPPGFVTPVRPEP
jgi:nucleotide-binding universal stress UspA family protein